MTVEIKAANISYSEFADKLLQRRTANADRSSFAPIAGKLISGGIAFLPKSMKDAMLIKLFEQNQSAIIAQLNRLLSDKGIKLEITNAAIAGGSDLMKIRFDIDNVNYEEIIIKFLPQITELIPKNDNTSVFTETLGIVGDNLEAMVKALLDTLDDEKKEQLVKLFANRYSLNISSFLNKLIADNGITAEITEIKIL